MPTYLAPGVYVEEVPAASRPIAGVGTSTAGFIGVVADTVNMPVGGGGVGAAGTATIAAGAITTIAVTTPGSGYSAATATITGDGSGATATVTVAGGVVTAIVVTTAGTGYTTATVTIVPAFH